MTPPSKDPQCPNSPCFPVGISTCPLCAPFVVEYNRHNAAQREREKIAGWLRKHTVFQILEALENGTELE